MQAPIAVVFGILNVILLFDEGYVILPQKHIGYCINIVNKGADYPHACHIVQSIFYGLHADRFSVPLKLFYDADRPFDT